MRDIDSLGAASPRSTALPQLPFGALIPVLAYPGVALVDLLFFAFAALLALVVLPAVVLVRCLRRRRATNRCVIVQDPNGAR